MSRQVVSAATLFRPLCLSVFLSVCLSVSLSLSLSLSLDIYMYISKGGGAHVIANVAVGGLRRLEVLPRLRQRLGVALQAPDARDRQDII